MPPLARRLLEWSRGDRASALTLASASLVAFVWANAAGGGYRRAWSTALAWLGFTGLEFSAREWVNHGLMTGFFVLIGLEIRREMRAGELGTWRRASGPIIAAVGGMAVPALLYALVLHGAPGGHGWGIPMATDVAFALGALALAGSHASRRWRVFLMTLAVADDILAIVVLVVIYSAGFDAVPAAAGIGCLVAMGIVRARRAGTTVIPVAFAAIAWWCLARAGLEAEIVGVAIGVAGLAGPRHGPRAWERRLQPAVSLAVLPAFALANTGVELSHVGLDSAAALRLFLAVLVARLIGKPLGIWLATSVFAKGGVRARLGVGAAASIGFTVPLLMVRAALGEGPLAESATAGLLASTAIGTLLTFVLLRQRRDPSSVLL